MTREKEIFYGRIDANAQNVQTEVDKFLNETFGSIEIKMVIEREGSKQLWVIYPPSPTDTERIINGYIEINPISLDHNSSIELRIVSCRDVLDLLFFQLSQRLQARFIISNFPSELLATPWKDLIKQGYISPRKTDPQDVLLNLPDPNDTVKKYGTERNLTRNNIRVLVKQCKGFCETGGTIEAFYEAKYTSCYPPFQLETFRKYLKDPVFN